LKQFSEEVVHYCDARRPPLLLSVGIAPLSAKALDAIGRMGVRRLNFLTDDPWSPAQRAPWFWPALRSYDHVFSPRRANLDDLRLLGCRAVSYVPFGYAPDIHFPEPEQGCIWDVAFAGGADRERVPWISALLRAGFKVGLYGGYWNRFAETRQHARGHADAASIRKHLASSRLALGLVRRSNRDGHSMRTFEVPAMGCCLLAEDTDEHREIFGDDGRRVSYFRTIPELIDKTSWLVGDEQERRRLASAAHQLIVSGGHTYKDRLVTMLQLAGTRFAAVSTGRT
jgi:hypothetical protein